MIEELHRLKQEFLAESDAIYDFVCGKTFRSSVFETPESFTSLDDRPDSLRGKRGIYIFMITKDVPLTRKQVRAWANVKGAGFNDWFQGNLKLGECLYVGSSTKSVYVRVRQHFLDSGEHTSLKLGHKNRNMLLGAIQVHVFPIKQEYAEYYRLILTSIEKNLHQKLHPKAGGSKV